MVFDNEARKELVNQVRIFFRPHFFMRCLEIAYRIIPCCNSCEHNKSGKCYAPYYKDSENFPHNVDWFSVEDGESLCLQWSPSAVAVLNTLYYVSKEKSCKKKTYPQASPLCSHKGKK
jgi:hypothetical protein